ncbi:MAG TPA: hypothetical protein VLG36_02630 [Candidatus Chromulinivoraceae bacterium]|nr:hypothetical protein [Candidatus Chromulinivoraceae bacterium]
MIDVTDKQEYHHFLAPRQVTAASGSLDPCDTEADSHVSPHAREPEPTPSSVPASGQPVGASFAVTGNTAQRSAVHPGGRSACTGLSRPHDLIIQVSRRRHSL